MSDCLSLLFGGACNALFCSRKPRSLIQEVAINCICHETTMKHFIYHLLILHESMFFSSMTKHGCSSVCQHTLLPYVHAQVHVPQHSQPHLVMMGYLMSIHLHGEVLLQCQYSTVLSADCWALHVMPAGMEQDRP